MSLDVAQMCERAGVKAIVVNNTFRLAPWADVLYAADADWWNHKTNQDARAFRGLKISCSAVKTDHHVFRMRVSGKLGYDPDPKSLRTGCNSGYQALHLAMHFRPKRILLCGYNYRGDNWHGKHVQGLRTTPREVYPTWSAFFCHLEGPASKLGIDVINCTPDSALTAFRHLPLEQALCLEQ